MKLIKAKSPAVALSLGASLGTLLLLCMGAVFPIGQWTSVSDQGIGSLAHPAIVSNVAPVTLTASNLTVNGSTNGNLNSYGDAGTKISTGTPLPVMDTNTVLALSNLLTRANSYQSSISNSTDRTSNWVYQLASYSAVQSAIQAQITNYLATQTNSGYTSSNPLWTTNGGTVSTAGTLSDATNTSYHAVVDNTGALKTTATFSGSVNTSTNMQSTLTDGTNGLVGVTSTHRLLTYTLIDPASAFTNFVIMLNTNAYWTTQTNSGGVLKVEASYASSPNVIATNAAGNYLEVAPRSGSNQVSFCAIATNLVNNVTNAGAANTVAWACTNVALHNAGDSGVLTGISITSATNQDFIVKVYSRVITAPTIGSAPNATRADKQYRFGTWATTNQAYSSGWVLDGTNYICHLGNLGATFKNTDASQNLMFVAIHLDTKTNYTASDTLFSAQYALDR